jgi:CheY-like chemotaxis protein
MAGMLEWVVVVECDPLVRSLLVEWLEEIGPRVQAFDGARALPVIGACLVVVDLVNVRQQGADIIRPVRTLYPGAPLIGLSTQARAGLGADSAAARSLGVDMLLPKPCERHQLQQAARALLAAIV